MKCPVPGCHKGMVEKEDCYECKCGFIMKKCPKYRGRIGVEG